MQSNDSIGTCIWNEQRSSKRKRRDWMQQYNKTKQNFDDVTKNVKE